VGACEVSRARHFHSSTISEFRFDIDWIEAQGDYSQLHVGKREYLLRESLTFLESRLDASSFLRIHRSAIVRIHRIVRVDSRLNRDSVITLASGSILRVSRTYNHHLRNLLRNRTLA
jgi:two-component system, LytTR family, response regulator